jgi:DNA-binding transcriptional MerR regulator
MTNDDLIFATEAAHILRCSPALIRKLAIEGRLAHTRTANGTRLYRRQDAEDLAAARQTERIGRDRRPAVGARGDDRVE